MASRAAGATRMASCLILLLLVGCAKDEEGSGERWFVPKYGPLAWFRDAAKREVGGVLPDRGKFLIKNSLDDVFEVEMSSVEPGKPVYVSKAGGFVTRIEPAVTFTLAIAFENRPPIRFWLGLSEIMDFISKDVAQNVLHDLEENLSTKWEPTRTALPILQFKTITAKSTKRELKLARAVIRLPPPAIFASLAAPEKDPDRIIFVVDVTNTMQPMGRQLFLSTLERLAVKDAKWRNDKQIGAVLFDGRTTNVKLQAFMPFGTAVDNLQSTVFQTAKAPAAKPVIDAIHLGLMNMHGRENARDVIVAFISAEPHAEASGSGVFTARKGMTFRELVAEFNRRRVNLVLVQATPDRGNELQRMLSNLERFGGGRTKSLSYGANLDRLIVSALDRFLSNDEQSRLVEESLQKLGQSISSIGGVPVFPRTQDFKASVSKIEGVLGSVPRGVQWVNVPVWIVAEQPMLKIQ